MFATETLNETQQERMASEMEAIFVFKCEDLWKKVQAVQQRARCRKLSEAELSEFLEQLLSVYAFCQEREIPTSKIFGRLDGGAVVNNYKYRAETTQVLFDGRGLRIERTFARKVPHGDDGVSRVGLLVPAQDEETKDKLREAGWSSQGGGYWYP